MRYVLVFLLCTLLSLELTALTYSTPIVPKIYSTCVLPAQYAWVPCQDVKGWAREV